MSGGNYGWRGREGYECFDADQCGTTGMYQNYNFVKTTILEKLETSTLEKIVRTFNYNPGLQSWTKLLELSSGTKLLELQSWTKI